MKKTINPYGTKFHKEHEESECSNCGMCGIPEYIVFEDGFPDAIPLCSYNCLLNYAQKKWESHVIQYVNSKEVNGRASSQQ